LTGVTGELVFPGTGEVVETRAGGERTVDLVDLMGLGVVFVGVVAAFGISESAALVKSISSSIETSRSVVSASPPIEDTIEISLSPVLARGRFPFSVKIFDRIGIGGRFAVGSTGEGLAA